jgi:hypothetical protein
MTYNAHIEKGAVALDEPIDLPEGSLMRLEGVHGERPTTLHEEFRHFIVAANDRLFDRGVGALTTGGHLRQVGSGALLLESC